MIEAASRLFKAQGSKNPVAMGVDARALSWPPGQHREVHVTYHDDKAAEHGHRMNESSVGSTDYWNHRMQQQNHQSMADAQRLHQETSSYLQNLQAQHTAPPVWRAGELPVGAGHAGTHSGSAGAALARLLGTKGFWYIAWLLLCACGYQWVDQGIRSAHATGWMQAVTPAGHVSSD